jgi:RNA polymerase sigma factor (sigma-70 family)
MSAPREHDPEALLAHGAYVRGLARELVFDAALARDVEQETWLAALGESARDPAATRGWLAAIVRNLARRAWRSSERRRAHEAAGAELERVVPSPEEVLEREELRRRVVEAVNALEEPYRAALVLRWLEGHDPREVARRLGVPPETARTRLKRGLELLRARFDRENRGGRGAWCLLFVRGFGLGPPSLVKLLGVSLSASFLGTSGVLSMAVVKKAVLASVLLASATTLFVFQRDAESSTAVRGSRAEPVELVGAEPWNESTSPVARETMAEPARESVGAPAPVLGAPQDPDVVSVSGRVLDPDGKPLAGAEVFLTRLYYDERYPEDPLAVVKSDEGGGFTLTYKKSDRRFKIAAERPEMWRHVTVSAFVPGVGPDWEYLATWPEGKALELRVVRDVPLTGRLLDLEGRPVAGVRVRVTRRAHSGSSIRPRARSGLRSGARASARSSSTRLRCLAGRADARGSRAGRCSGARASRRSSRAAC